MRAVNENLAVYRGIMARQPACCDPWFSDQLHRYRFGDEGAQHSLREASVRLSLEIVERTMPGHVLDDGFEAIQEANWAAVEALDDFQGYTAHEFKVVVTAAILRRLAATSC